MSAPGSELRPAHLLGLAERTAPDEEDLFPAWAAVPPAMARRISSTRSSKIFTGPMPACSIFIEYLSLVRHLPYLRAHAWRVPSCSRGGPPGVRADEASTRSCSSPSRTRHGRSSSTGWCPDFPEDGPSADPRARRGRAALRGRDDSHASRPRASCTRERGVPGHRAGGIARGAGDTPGADRGPAGWPGGGGTPPVGGCGRARQDLHGRALTAVSGYDGAELEAALGALSARRYSRWSTILARPSAASTASSMRCFRGSPTTRSRGRSARRAISARRSYLERTPTDDEVVEVIALHYLAAYRASPEAADAPEIRAKARERLARAAASAPPRSRPPRRRSATSSRQRSPPTSGSSRPSSSSARESRHERVAVSRWPRSISSDR